MFKYDLTGKQSQPGEKQRKLVSEYREVTYIHFSEEKKENYEIIGRETVREVSVPPEIGEIVAVCVDTKVLDYSEGERKAFEKKQRNLFRRKD